MHQSPTGRGWAGFLPSKPGSKDEDTRKVPKTICWGTLLKLSHLTCYLNSYRSYLFYILYTSETFQVELIDLKINITNSPPSSPLMKRQQNNSLEFFFFKAFLTSVREAFKLHFVSWSHSKRRQRKWSISDSGSQRCFVSLLIESETSCRWWVEPS